MRWVLNKSIILHLKKQLGLLGISVVYQCFPVVYHWKSAVKFGGTTSGIPVFSSGMTNGIPVVYHWKSVVKFGGITTLIH